MSVFTDAQAKATDKIRQYGGTIRVVRTSPVDDITGTGGVDTIVGSGKAIQTEYFIRAIDGDKIKMGDKRLLVEASVVLQEDDKIQFGGKMWTIKRIEELNLDGETRVFAKVQVRA